jgi:hypothetical protein
VAKIICKKTDCWSSSCTATAFKSIPINNASEGMEIEGLLALANIQPWVSKIQIKCSASDQCFLGNKMLR